MLKEGVVFIPSVRNHLVGVHGCLASLRPFFQHVLELENEDSKLTNLQTHIISVIHFATYVINLCPVTSFSVWYGIVCLPNVMQDIRFVKSAIEKIEDDLHSYASKQIVTEIGSSNALLPEGTVSKHEGVFVGFRKEVESILDHLLGGQQALTIISISGMAGQGKTTLAKRIFNDPSIRYHFHKIAWGYVGKQCNLGELMASILWFDSDEKDRQNFELQDLANHLRRSLKRKRYLLVLDDIWDVDILCELQQTFPDDRNGSRILCTSRNHDLARKTRLNLIPHPLPLFSVEESLELIKENLSYSDGFPYELWELGRQIAILCKGLPLAAAVIASHLKRIPREWDMWMEVVENMRSHLDSEGCMHIIETSYKYLPHHLKPCFLYFGIFPKGAIVRAATLLRVWISKGFVMTNKQQCAEDLSREYLNYLVSQNLVIVTQRGSMGTIKRCKVHDLIHDLCFQKAVEDNLLDVVGYGAVPREYNNHKRWLSIHVRQRRPYFTQLTSSSTRKKLPTSQVNFLLWRIGCDPPRDNKSLYYYLSNFRVLTVLNMWNVPLLDSTIPEIIFTNLHLRHLTLRGDFHDIPRSIVKLWNLESLELRPEKYILRPSKYVWEMKSLCWLWVKRSHLCIEQNMSSTAAASNIDSLGGMIIPYDVETREFLKNLSRLRKLDCFYDTELHPEWLSMFGSLTKLESLRIERHIGYHVIPDSLNRGWRNLRISFPDTLKKLSMWETGLPWEAMSVVGKLPNLQVLKLWRNAFKGSTWDLGDGEFSNLKYLKLYRMNVEQLNDISDCEPPFPCLEKLEVYHCKRLAELPSSFGDICTLNTIKLISSPKVLDSARSIEEQQKEMGNHDLQLDISGQDNLDLYFRGSRDSDDDE